MPSWRTIIHDLWPSKIRSQLILGVALVHLLLMSFFVFDLVARQREFLTQQSLEHTTSLANTLALNSSSWTLANDVVGLEEIVMTIEQHPGLRSAMVIATDGQVLAHTDASHIGQHLADEKSRALLGAAPETLVLHADQDLLDIASPILSSNGTLIGWARVAQDQKGIADNLMILSRNGILYTLLAIAAGSLLAIILGNRLTSGLHQLLGVCMQIKTGRRDLRMEITGHNEVALLGVGLNSMLEAIIANENLLLLNQQRLECLANILQSQAANQQELLDYALEQALLLTDSRLGYICYYNEETQEFTLNSWSRETMQECAVVGPPTRFQLATCGLWGEAVRQRKAILINNFQAENPLKRGCPQGHVALQNYLTIPVLQGGKIVAVVGVANKGEDYSQTDISQLAMLMDAVWKIVERMHTAETLSQREQSLKEAQRIAQLGNWDLDLTTNKLFWSDIIYQIFEIDPQEFDASYEAFLATIHPDDREAVDLAYTESLKNKTPYESVHRLLMKDGRVKHVHERGETFYDSAGQPLRSAGTVQDITERKQTEQALAQADREWFAAMDASEDIIYLLNLKRHIMRANKSFYLTTGTNPETAIGRHIVEVVHPKGEAVPCPVCHAQEEKRDLQIIMEADHSDNPVGRPLEITVKIVRDQKEQPMSILMTLHDLSAARKEMEEKLALEKQLRQAQKMEAIGTLAGGIAHDFNNILSIIFGYTELAMAEKDPASCHRHLEEVTKGAHRAKELVQQILTFSRKMEQQRHPLQVSLVVKEALKMLRASIPTTIEIRQNILSEGTVLADPTQIHQIVMNLCTNAYHAMRETGGTLSVSLGEVEIGPHDFPGTGLPPGRYLKLEVSDTGCGIEPQLKEKIFEPYFTTKKQGDGTGLGLAVVHGIAKSHHGHIAVESVVGKGTSIQVYLPMTAEKATISQSLIAPENLDGNGERILFVDDEEQIRGVAELMLSQHGYQVTCAADGQEALTEFNNHPDHFQVLITDMTMPIMTGAELARQVLALKPGLPVILCTGQSELINREKALAMGIADYLNKPFAMQTILGAIRTALTKKP